MSVLGWHGCGSYAIYVKGMEKSSTTISTERPTVETADQAWDILQDAIDSQGMGVRLALVSEEEATCPRA